LQPTENNSLLSAYIVFETVELSTYFHRSKGWEVERSLIIIKNSQGPNFVLEAPLTLLHLNLKNSPHPIFTLCDLQVMKFTIQCCSGYLIDLIGCKQGVIDKIKGFTETVKHHPNSGTSTIGIP
jgi:hypothetical protein